jgi:hypothetical protein
VIEMLTHPPDRAASLQLVAAETTIKTKVETIAEKPVFIAGLHRSGTSLVRAIVGSHPTLAIYQYDLPLWQEFYEFYKNQDLNDVTICTQLVDAILSHKKVQLLSTAIDRSRLLSNLERVRATGEITIDCGVVFAHFLQQYARSQGRSRWGLKTPFQEHYAEAILQAYPTAKILHVIRDPRDVLVSIKSRGWYWDLKKRCKEWRNSARLAQHLQQTYPLSYQVIRYEDLVAQPVPIVRLICAFLELEYLPDLLLMQGQPRWSGSNSRFADVGWHSKTISPIAVGRYDGLLSDADIEFCQSYLADEMHYWGYEKG